MTSTSKGLVLSLLGTDRSLEFEKFSLPHSFTGLFTFVCNWRRIIKPRLLVSPRLQLSSQEDFLKLLLKGATATVAGTTSQS